MLLAEVMTWAEVANNAIPAIATIAMFYFLFGRK